MGKAVKKSVYSVTCLSAYRIVLSHAHACICLYILVYGHFQYFPGNASFRSVLIVAYYAVSFNLFDLFYQHFTNVRLSCIFFGGFFQIYKILLKLIEY